MKGRIKLLYRQSSKGYSYRMDPLEIRGVFRGFSAKNPRKKGEKHLEWILGKNDKGTLIYNIRLGKNVEGGQVKAHLNKMVVSFVVLYEYGHESENQYRVFRVHHHASMDKARLIKSQYPSEPNSEKYFCYVFDEEVTLGDLDIHALLSSKRIVEKIEDNGAPIFVSGKELLEYRR